MSNQKVRFYVDGSYNKAENISGWGVVVVDSVTQDIVASMSGVVEDVKMNQIEGELKAAMMAAKQAKSWGVGAHIVYDYIGIEKWPTRQWQAKNERTRAYVEYMDSLGIPIRYEWVKGHSGEEFNELVDSLAKKAIEEFLLSSGK